MQINNINKFELTVFVLAILMHFGIVLWAIWDLWALQALPSQTAEEASALGVAGLTPRSIRLIQLIVLFYWVSILGVALLVLISFTWFCALTKYESSRAVHVIQLVFRLLLLVLGIGCFISAILYNFPPLLGLPSLLNIILFFLTFIVLLFLEWVIRWLCSRYESLSVNLLMVPETTNGSEPPSRATWSLVFFIVNLIVCNLWCCLRYDLTGTVYPSWTGVFG